MTLNDTQKALLTLLAQALWGNGGALVETDWEQVEELAKDQGVLPMLYRGAMKYKDIIPADRIRIWRGAMYAAVLQNEHVNQAQSEILGWLSENGIRAAILKGTSVARYYSPSDMRYLGDIDLLIDQSNLDLASEVLKEHGYRLNEHEHDFHIAFVRGDITLELHYRASVVPNGKGGQAAAKIMERFLDEAIPVKVNDMSFPALSEKHQALMLLMHKERHVMASGIGLRQLCDWAVFLSSLKKLSCLNEIVCMCQECGLFVFLQVVTKASIKYLGLEGEGLIWSIEAEDTLVDALMIDVFRSGNMGKADKNGDSFLMAGRSILENHKQNAFVSFVMNLNKLANKHFPITLHNKWLLPIFWIFLPLRYIVRSLFGMRPKKNVFDALKRSNQRFELQKSMHLYEVK